MFLLTAQLLSSPPLAAADDRCLPPGPGTAVRVSGVVDGDTLRLDDGTLVRLIGIDAPELGRDGRESQPFAEDATETLSRLIPDDGQVVVHPGPEARDRHGRSLAHVAVDGLSLAALILNQGVARLAVVPPNASQAACLSNVELAARRAQRGLWQHPVPGFSAEMRQGFVHLRGTLVRSELQDDGRWFGELEGGLWLTAYPDALSAFPMLVDPAVGSEVEVRGWLSRGRHPRLIIRHPAQLSLATEPVADAGL